MQIIQEVKSSLDAVTNSVNHIQTISAAINHGLDHLEKNYPQADDDLAVICEELRKSLDALVSASTIVTHFKFVDGEAQEADASRFRQHLIKQELQAGKVEQQIDLMRGHCQVIIRHAEKIRDKIDPEGHLRVSDILGFFFPSLTDELEEALEYIYDEKKQYAEGVYAMAVAIRGTLREVEEKLEPEGRMREENVPDAASVLNEYAVAFETLEARCDACEAELQTSIDSLQQMAAY